MFSSGVYLQPSLSCIWSILGSVLFSSAPQSLIQPLIFSVGYGVLSVPYVLVLALVIGLAEECSFRGYILRNLRGSFSEGKAVLYSSVLFGLYHISIFYVYSSTCHPLKHSPIGVASFSLPL